MTQTSAPIRPPASAARPAAPRVEAPSSQEGEHRPPPEPVAREAQGGEATATEGPKPAARTFGPGELSAIADAGNPDDVEAALEVLASGNDGSRQQGMAEGREDENKPEETHRERVERIRQETKVKSVHLDIPEEVQANPQFTAIFRQDLAENAKNRTKGLQAVGMQALSKFYDTPEGQSALQNDQQFMAKKQEIAARLQSVGKQATEQEVHNQALNAYLKEKYGETPKERKDAYKTDSERQNADYNAKSVASENPLIKQLDLALTNAALSEEQIKLLMEQREELWRMLYDKEYYGNPQGKKNLWIMILAFIVSTLISESKTLVVDNIMPDQRR